MTVERQSDNIASFFWLTVVLISSYFCIFESYRYDSNILEISVITLLLSTGAFYYAYIEIPIANERLNKILNQVLAIVISIGIVFCVILLNVIYNNKQIEKYNYIADGIVINYKDKSDNIYATIKYTVDNKVYFTDFKNPEYKIKIGTKVYFQCSKRQPERVDQIVVNK